MAFRQRVDECKQRQRNVEAELRFTALIDSQPSDSVSVLSQERRRQFLSKCMASNQALDPDFVMKQFQPLMRVVEEEYKRQMKKCVLLKQMEDPANHDQFLKMKVPVRLTKTTKPYFGVVTLPKYPFAQYQNEILHVHWCTSTNMEQMTRVFTKKCIEYQQNRFMQTKASVLKLPNELAEMKQKQESHHKSTALNVMHRWREFLVGEIADKLKEDYNFFEDDMQVYSKSQLKRVILRFEFIMNSYLRNFVH